MKPLWVFDYVHRENFYFFEAWKTEDLLSYLKKKFKYDLGHIDDGCGGLCFVIEGKGVGIWIRRKIQGPDGYSDFVHELQHACMAVLLSRGIQADLHNHEPFAYHLGFLVRGFLEERERAAKK